MRFNLTKFFLLIIGSLMILTGCNGQNSGSTPATQAVMTYLNAMVSQNSDRLSTVACKAWEDQAMLDMDSFVGVSAKLDNAVCKESGKEGDATIVSCNGNILATYNNELQKIDLSTHAYKVVQEGGDWKVCGYKN